MNPEKKQYYKQHFRKEWQQMDDFRGWLCEVPGDSRKAYCQYCDCNVGAKYYDIVKHKKTKKHVAAEVAAPITQTVLSFMEENYENNTVSVVNETVRFPGHAQNQEDYLKTTINHPTRSAYTISAANIAEIHPPKIPEKPTLLKKKSKLEAKDETISLPHKRLREQDDEFEKIGAAWACELRKMDQLQQMFAKKAINDVLFEGQLGTLSRNSVIINSPPPPQPQIIMHSNFGHNTDNVSHHIREFTG